MMTLILYAFDGNADRQELHTVGWTGLPVPATSQGWTFNGIRCSVVGHRVEWVVASAAGAVTVEGRIHLTLLPSDERLHGTRWWETR